MLSSFKASVRKMAALTCDLPTTKEAEANSCVVLSMGSGLYDRGADEAFSCS